MIVHCRRNLALIMNPIIKKIFQLRYLFICFCFSMVMPALGFSQKADLHEFEKREDSLKKFGYSIVFANQKFQSLSVSIMVNQRN